MPRGILEVLLVNAEGLNDTDLFGKMDPYVILTCRTQKQKSTVVSGAGSNPEWNETFTFSIGEGATDLNLKIYDKDFAKEDDFVGEASISLQAVFIAGKVLPAPYNIVLRDQTFCGQIKVGLTFTPERLDGKLGESWAIQMYKDAPWHGEGLFLAYWSNSSPKNDKSYQPVPQQYQIVYTHFDDYVPNFTFILHQDEQLRWHDMEGNIVLPLNQVVPAMLYQMLTRCGLQDCHGEYIVKDIDFGIIIPIKHNIYGTNS